MPIIRVFYGGLPPANAWTTGSAGINNSAVVVSFEALPSAILSGADDASLRHFFDTAPTGHTIYYSFDHEPESYVLAGKFSTADYRAAWARVVALADAAHNPYLKSTLILMAWDLSARSGVNWKDYLPSGGIITTLGWDAYPAGTIENKNPQLTPPAQFMGPAVAASKAAGLPFGFAEFALATQVGRPQWLTEVGSYLASVGAKFGTLFNSPLHTHDEVTDAASYAAWRQVVASSGLDTQAIVNPAPAPAADPEANLVSGLTAAPASFASGGTNHVTIKFTLAASADVTVCVLNDSGTVVRTLARPARPAGRVVIRYYGHDTDGRALTGQFNLLIIASNAQGSVAMEEPVTITSG